MTAAIARRATNKEMPDKVCLLSPLTDMAMTGLSNVYNRYRDSFTGPEAVIHKNHHYLQGANPTDPRASALWGDLSGLPPIQIIVGDREVMLDDSTRLASRLRSTGGHVELVVGSGAPHVYPLVFPDVPESKEALKLITRFILS